MTSFDSEKLSPTTNIKGEQEQKVNSDEENDLEEINNILSMKWPSINFSNVALFNDSNDEFLKLTSLVRSVYFSYLHKCLLNNYIICHNLNNQEVSNIKLKEYADELELVAVRHSLHTTLYRKNMLKLISDIREHTSQKKIYKKMQCFLDAPLNKIDVAVQTIDPTNNSFQTENVNKKHFSKDAQNLDDIEKDIFFDDSIDKMNTINTELENEQSHEIDTNYIGNSPDSLTKHMEDIFCESDDSTDLTLLIEKHPNVIKANVNEEIKNISSDNITQNKIFFNSEESNKNGVNDVLPEKFSLDFQQMRSQNEHQNVNESEVIKRKQKTDAVWSVEYYHQKSKLNETLVNLSSTNYRKYNSVKQKYSELFGDDYNEDLEPVSPICTDDHLTACKERIAPWVVKYLMPYYKRNKIKNRQLFKLVAKHIVDMLITTDMFPEEDSIQKYIQNYFKNKNIIELEQDIYL